MAHLATLQELKKLEQIDPALAARAGQLYSEHIGGYIWLSQRRLIPVPSQEAFDRDFPDGNVRVEIRRELNKTQRAVESVLHHAKADGDIGEMRRWVENLESQRAELAALMKLMDG
ncbi:hypothetical protein RQP46_010370 [Phenoliferia psychrophenolica]